MQILASRRTMELMLEWCPFITNSLYELVASWVELFFSLAVKTDLSSPECLRLCDVFGTESWTYSAANNRVICEEWVNDIFTITELGRSVFICACISVYHVKHLHLIEFQMLSGIVMKPGPHCYGNLGLGGGSMLSPQNPFHDILMFAFMLGIIFVFVLKNKKKKTENFVVNVNKYI